MPIKKNPVLDDMSDETYAAIKQRSRDLGLGAVSDKELAIDQAQLALEQLQMYHETAYNEIVRLCKRHGVEAGRDAICQLQGN